MEMLQTRLGVLATLVVALSLPAFAEGPDQPGGEPRQVEAGADLYAFFKEEGRSWIVKVVTLTGAEVLETVYLQHEVVEVTDRGAVIKITPVDEDFEALPGGIPTRKVLTFGESDVRILADLASNAQIVVQRPDTLELAIGSLDVVYLQVIDGDNRVLRWMSTREYPGLIVKEHVLYPDSGGRISTVIQVDR